MYSECHGHIFMDGRNYKEAMELHRHGVVRQVIRDRLRALADNGVTYYRDGGDILGASEYAREIAGEYGIEFRACLFATHKRGSYGGIVGRAFDGPGEFYGLVKKAKAEKADFIKLMISGIMDFQSFGGLMGGGLDPDEIPELIRIAHGEGFRVMTHTNGAERIKAALEAGADSIEHGYFGDDECIRLFAETGALWVPTLAATAGFIGRSGFGEGVAQANVDDQKAKLAKAAAAGVLIAAGSDAGAFGVSPSAGIITEHRLLAEAGVGEDLIARGDAAVRERFVYGL
jgi:imidazolonepropionase-like amidohydrolase